MKNEGGILLAATGYIQIRAYTSRSEIPLRDVAVTITAPNGTATAMRLTNRSGKFDNVIAVTVPDKSESLDPNPDEVPFATVDLYARKDDYAQIAVYGIQVFADTLTQQNLEFIPLSEFPESWDQEEVFMTPPQDL